MSAALLVRGMSHYFGPARNWGVDWRLSLASQRKHLLEPLEARHGPLDVYLATYAHPHLDSLRRDYGSVGEVILLDPEKVTMRQTFLAGVDLVLDSGKRYDVVVTSRFDLEFLQSPLDWPYKPHAINFLWREWNQESWDNHRRVPDCWHLVAGPLLQGFRDGVAATHSEICLHFAYLPTAARVGEENINIMRPEGFANSNPSWPPHNDLYKLIRVSK